MRSAPDLSLPSSLCWMKLWCVLKLCSCFQYKAAAKDNLIGFYTQAAAWLTNQNCNVPNTEPAHLHGNWAIWKCFNPGWWITCVWLSCSSISVVISLEVNWWVNWPWHAPSSTCVCVCVCSAPGFPCPWSIIHICRCHISLWQTSFILNGDVMGWRGWVGWEFWSQNVCQWKYNPIII